MKTLYLTHPVFLEHRESEGHPECIARMEAVHSAVKEQLPDIEEQESHSIASSDDLLLAHTQEHVNRILSLVPKEGRNFYNAETYLSPLSGEAALRAAGTILEAIEKLSKHSKVFCAVRPPGHHACRDSTGGFCLFNNVAIGALAAIRKYGYQRPAIIDFDVHHGNGTQDILWDNPDIFFASVHQAYHYPGTGHAHETGAHDQILNIPMPAGTRGEELIAAFKERVIPRLQEWQPDILFVSAGFDGHRDDLLGGWNLTSGDYGVLMSMLCAAANDLCDGRLVCSLEGGYDLPGLASSVANVLRVMDEYNQ